MVPFSLGYYTLHIPQRYMLNDFFCNMTIKYMILKIKYHLLDTSKNLLDTSKMIKMFISLKNSI